MDNNHFQEFYPNNIHMSINNASELENSNGPTAVENITDTLTNTPTGKCRFQIQESKITDIYVINFQMYSGSLICHCLMKVQTLITRKQKLLAWKT